MDAMHWVDANDWQERGTVESLRRMLDFVHKPHPDLIDLCSANNQCSNLTLLSHKKTLDGSLNDILIPFQHCEMLQSSLPHQSNLLSHHEEPRVEKKQKKLREQNLLIHPTFDVQCNDLLPPLPSSRQRLPKRKGTTLYREAHVHSERQRRSAMACLFSKLGSLLPNLQCHDKYKVDRCTLIGQIMEYIPELEKKVQDLVKMKDELTKKENGKDMEEVEDKGEKAEREQCAFKCYFWGHEAIVIILNFPKHSGVWLNLLALLEDTLQLEVQNVSLSANPYFYTHSIYAKVVQKENQDIYYNKLRKTLGDFLSTYMHKMRRMEISSVCMS